MRYRSSTHTSHLLDTPFGEVEIQYPADLTDWGGTLVHREGDHLVVAYLSHDEDGNSFGEPFHDGDGYIVGRGSYQNRNHDESEMFEALGLDRNGDTNYDLVSDKVIDAWKEYLDTVTPDTWYDFIEALYGNIDMGERVELINKWRDELSSTNIAWEGETKYAVMQANKYVSWTTDPSNDDCTRAATHLDFDVEKVTHRIFSEEAEAGRIGNPYAVILDVYEHGGVAWSVSGRGQQCRWDTSRGAGVWLPDDVAKGEIERRAPVYATHYIRDTPIRMKGSDNKYQIIEVDTNNCIAMSDNWGVLWEMAKKYAEAQGDMTDKDLQFGRYMAAQELAAQAVETYNSWCSGDIYGVIVEHFKNVADEGDDPNWESVEEEACWGHIGDDYAKETMTSEFEAAVKHLQNATVTTE